MKTSLLLRLQAQTLPDATPPIGKSTPSVKWTYLLNQWYNCDTLQNLESSLSLWHSLFYNWKSYLYWFGRGGAVKLWGLKDDLRDWGFWEIIEQNLCKSALQQFLQNIFFADILNSYAHWRISNYILTLLHFNNQRWPLLLIGMKQQGWPI